MNITRWTVDEPIITDIVRCPSFLGDLVQREAQGADGRKRVKEVERRLRLHAARGLTEDDESAVVTLTNPELPKDAVALRVSLSDGGCLFAIGFKRRHTQYPESAALDLVLLAEDLTPSTIEEACRRRVAHS